MLRGVGLEENTNFRLVMIYIDPYGSGDSSFLDTDTELIKYAVENILSDIAQEQGISKRSYFVFHHFEDIHHLFVLMTGKHADLFRASSRDLMRKLQCQAAQHLKIGIRISLSNIQEQIGPSLYSECKTAYYLRFLQRGEFVYFYEDIKEEGTIDREEIVALQTLLERRDAAGIKKSLQHIFNENASALQLESIFRMVIHTVILTLSKMAIQYPKDLCDQLTVESLEAFYDFEQLTEYLWQTIAQLLGLERIYDAKEAVEWTEQFVKANYANEIAIADIAQSLHFHPCYFSALFKRETGKTFVKYLREVRIQKACELLEKTELSNQEVALRVGYREGQYFYKVFKSVMHMTPLDYRMQHL